MIDISSAPTVGFLVWRLSMKWRNAVDRAVQPLGLTHAKYSVLSSLYGMQAEGRKPSQRELADRTGLDVVYISKLAQSLERSELIERTRDTSDSRAIELSITKEGLNLAQEAIAIVHQLTNDLTAPLGGLHSDRTSALMDELRVLLQGELPDHQ